MVDFTATFFLIWVHILTTFVFLNILRKASKPISRLCSTMAKLNECLGLNEKHLKNITRRSYFALGLLFILHILSILTSVKFSQYAFDNIFEDTPFSLPMYSMWFLTVAIFYWPFPAAASFLVNRLCLVGIVLQMDTFESKAPKSK